MQKLSGLFKVFSNKYLLSVVIFLVWIAFFDRNDLFTQHERKQELKKLEKSATFYQKEIAATKQDLTDMNNDPAVLEKMAREHFYLKRKGEEIFLVTTSSDGKK